MTWPFEGLERGHYAVIMADPPWRFLTYSARGRRKSADRHYNCMTLDDLKALPVAELAAPNCALFFWHTASNLRTHALPVLDAWGFTYKTMGPWTKLTADGKPHFGTGYIMRNAWEPFIVATRGKPKRISRSERDVILARRREHSRKPDEIYPKIEALYAGPYLELFSRTDRPGWTSWGDQTGVFRHAA